MLPMSVNVVFLLLLQCLWIQPCLSLSSLSSRRQILISGAGAMIATTTTTTIDRCCAANAATTVEMESSIDMNQINAIRASTRKNDAVGPMSRSIYPMVDPPPNLIIRGGIGGTSSIQIPRIGYSFYKTAVDQAERCTMLALRAGVRHLDMATTYESNPMIAKALKKYLDGGMSTFDLIDEEKPEVIKALDTARLAGEIHTKTNMGGGGVGGGSASMAAIAPAPLGSVGRRGRRESLFLSHKISNHEQSTDVVNVRRSVKAAIATLGCSYLDLVSIHSPLTNRDQRLASYQALLDLRDSGFIKSVGVCNYGLGPLKEIAAAGLELPAINQLELSPFNAHTDIVNWCDKNGVAIACSAWSKLSSTDGPTEGWDILSKLAQQKGMTKAQVLVRWSLQKGYVCVPRSASASKLERIAIAENSYGGVNPMEQSFTLTSEEMATLDSLDVGYRAGKLGRRDGWLDTDVTGPEWDPTDHAV